jgi:hypothetical protein
LRGLVQQLYKHQHHSDSEAAGQPNGTAVMPQRIGRCDADGVIQRVRTLVNGIFHGRQGCKQGRGYQCQHGEVSLFAVAVGLADGVEVHGNGVGQPDEVPSGKHPEQSQRHPGGQVGGFVSWCQRYFDSWSGFHAAFWAGQYFLQVQLSPPSVRHCQRDF